MANRKQGIPVLMLNGAKMVPHVVEGKGKSPSTTYQQVTGAADGNRIIVVKDDGTEHFADLFIGGTLQEATLPDPATGESRTVKVRGRVLSLRFTADPPANTSKVPLPPGLKRVLDALPKGAQRDEMEKELRQSYTF